jgi:hypothetical protein
MRNNNADADELYFPLKIFIFLDQEEEHPYEIRDVDSETIIYFTNPSM